MNAADSFWRDRRVLLTGHTGFKGAWLTLMLRELGAEVTGFALAPDTQPNLASLLEQGSRSIIADIRDAPLLQNTVTQADPQVVIHMAAQALVRESYRDPVATFATNVMGTANLLQACRALKRLQCILVVTSDKVYENDGAGRTFSEQDRLGGHDPYSNSKACAELLTGSFRDSFYASGPPVATVRAGNVIGGGDWSQDRLIPDCVRAMDAGGPVRLRYPAAQSNSGSQPGPSPSLGRTITSIPLSASAIFKPTAFSLPPTRSALFSSSVPWALASSTFRRPSASLVRL